MHFNFTEYLFDPSHIKSLVAEREKSLAANRGIEDLLSFGLGVVAERLSKDRLRYRDYGPYWWALKDVMNRSDYALGDQSDPLLMSAYQGDSDVDTLVMADEFRNEYLKTSMILTNQFMLDGESGKYWTLYDEDMELPPSK